MNLTGWTMDNSKDYSEGLERLRAKSKELEDAYIEKQKRGEAKEFTPVSDRNIFGGSPTCPRCSESSLGETKTHVEGCRYNGDSYGTYSRLCESCGYLSEKRYDEA